MFTIRNAYTGHVYATAATLQEARNKCGQALLRCPHDRQRILSDLAAGLIEVYEARDASCPGVFRPGF